ncbi:ATP-binding protein [Actinosynnema sp. NPDC050801]|uniref:NACHT domain-containing protein n=1 Tax=unclassified Actinosynnema TaxID=2637065 RepID=UPI0033C31A94
MRRSLSYGDAVKLLGGDTGLVKFLDHASAAGVVATGGIDLLDARTEVVRVGKQVLSSVRERVHGLHRVDRTRLLEAAHSILVITAFFEAVDDVGLPFKLKIGPGEQLTLAGADRPASRRKADLVRVLLGTSIPLPSPEQPPDAVTDELSSFYTLMVSEVVDFLSGFEVWYDLTEAERDEFGTRATAEVPYRAVDHYRSRYRQLSLECPELAVWTSGIEHAATRAEVRTGLADLRAFLGRLVGAQLPDDRRNALARGYRAALDRPIVAGDVPSGLVLPTLARAYVPPRFKVVEADTADDVSADGWWSEKPVRVHLDDYLAGYFTSSQATAAPLVVLGQPGAGKSLLTKMLAAQLPAEDYLPIRVVLRDVAADTTLQDQIEAAVTHATGERLTWPDLARSAKPAIPVVLLDGFDELLQATGTSKSDYLARVREFQQRELDQGRAVIVVVTTRVAVANRARLAGPTMVLRLEPFSADQVRRWLDVWNTANPGAVLEPDVALRFDDLAGQPLLLFMLALYNADGNALDTEGAELAKARLYERLLTRFARREVDKSLRHALDDQVELAVEEDLVRLSVVAFAMFNRGVQWIDESDLDDDLNALLHSGARGVRDKLRLSSAQLAVGRFFFVHAARAAHDDQVSRTYEFLHATFGEYLVARLVHRLSLEVLAKERAATSLYGRQEGTGWLEPVLSFASLTTRTPVISFLRELFDDTPEADRAELHELFTALLATAQHRLPGADHPDYLPRTLPIAHRIAAYTANLVVLAVVVGGRWAFPDRTTWQSLTLLWQSQLGEEEWDTITQVLTIEPSPDPSVVLRGDEPLPRVDVSWLLEMPNPHASYDLPDYLHEIHRWESVHTSWREGMLLHNLEPVMVQMSSAMSLLLVHQGRLTTPVHLLLTALTAPDPSERVAAYTSALTVLRPGLLLGVRYWSVLFDAVASDPAATPALLEQVVSLGSGEIRPLIRCALRLVADTGEEHPDAVNLVAQVVADRAVGENQPHVVAEALVGFIELGFDLALVFQDVPSLLRDLDLDRIAATDRHLHVRLRRALESIGLGDHMAR